MTSRGARWLTALGIAAALAGCGRSDDGAAGKVAMLNLDQVAHELGRDELFERTLRATQQEAEEKLRGLEAQIKRSIQDEAAKLGPLPAREDTEKFEALRRSMNERWTQELSQTQKRLEAMRAELIEQFRNDVRPIARRVAAAHGMGIIELRHPGVLDADPNSDITADVIAEMKRLTPTAAPAPTEQRPLPAMPSVPLLPAPPAPPAPPEPPVPPAPETSAPPQPTTQPAP